MDPPDESQLSVPCSSRMAARILFRMRLCNVLGFWFAAAIVIALSYRIGYEISRESALPEANHSA